MNKKIVILNGSPRLTGNTVGIIDAFTEGAEKAKNEVKRFDLQELEIHPCKGCYMGGQDPNSPCVQKDDMEQIYRAVGNADIVVLASPLYYWSFSGQLKCAFDRLFALAEINSDHHHPQKDAILLMAAESFDIEEIKFYYNKLLDHIEWNNLGMVFIGGVRDIGDIKNKDLKEAKDLGLSI